jgi:hypothetical protein
MRTVLEIIGSLVFAVFAWRWSRKNVKAEKVPNRGWSGDEE